MRHGGGIQRMLPTSFFLLPGLKFSQVKCLAAPSAIIPAVRYPEMIETLDPLEFLALSRFIDDYKARFTKADLKFLNSHLGRRAERLLSGLARSPS